MFTLSMLIFTHGAALVLWQRFRLIFWRYGLQSWLRFFLIF